MPYADPDTQRKAQREGAARRRHQAKLAAARDGATAHPVVPAQPLDATPILPPLTAPPAAEIEYVARLLNITPQRGDTPEKVHMRAKLAWQRLLAVVEE